MRGSSPFRRVGGRSAAEMGLYFVNAVLNGLKGRKLSVGKKKLTASDIAMLVTIANQQPNPGSYHGDWNPAATIDPKSMSAYTHLARSKVFTKRDFLLDLGLITFTPKEMHADPTSPTGQKAWTNLYRINLKKIRELVGDDQEWLKVLKIDKTPPDENTRRALFAVPIGDSTVPKTAKTVPSDPSEVPIGDTNIHKNRETQENLTNINTLCDVLSDEQFDLVLGTMAKSLMVPPNRIGRKSLARATLGKFYDSIMEIVSNPNEFIRNANDKIAATIHCIQILPQKENDPSYLRYQRMFNPEQAFSSASREARCLVDDVKRNTGITDRRMLAQVVLPIERLLNTVDGKEFAVETVAKHSKANMPGKNSLELILGLKDELQDFTL